MKHVFFRLAVLIFLPFSLIAQDEETEKTEKFTHPLLVSGKLPIDSFFVNRETGLIHEEVLKFENIKQADLLKKVKNWAALTFVNLKEVLISETDDQILLNYIEKSLFDETLFTTTYYSEYIRLQIQFKDNKIKCSFFDDGNVLELPSKYSSGQAARSTFLTSYFREKKGQLVAKNSFVKGLIALKTSLKATAKSMQAAVEKSVSNSDW